ncbi:MAG: tetratricopeptide repeat protein, partial [Planctomycetes bacterium]|nr:tetratricopeptide repeat protein [Planctomycetota bacterium]
ENFVETKTEDFTFRLHKDDNGFILPYLQPLMIDAKKRMEAQYEVTISKPITFEDFSKHQYFSARSIGLPGLAASGVCFGRMVTLTTPKAIPGNWGAVATHEFGHVIALHKALQRVPRWLTEGLSVFEEGRAIPTWTRYFADEFAEAAIYDGLLPMANLQSGFTKPDTPQRVLLSYYQGGVISRYITEKYGWDKIVAMLGAYAKGHLTEKVFRDVLGLSLEEFDRGFFEYAKQLSDSFGIAPRIPLGKVEEFRYFTEDHPEDPEGWVRLALAYYFNGKETDAELAAGKALAFDTPIGDLEACLGMIKLGQGKTKRAGEHFEKAIELGTRYRYRCYYGLAQTRARRDDAEGAIEALKAAIAIHPTGIRPRFGGEHPYYQLFELLNENDREDEAIRVLEDLARIDRDDMTSRVRLLKHYAAQENWKKAIEFGWDAPFIDPYYPDAHDLLARAYLAEQRFEEARRELEVFRLTEDAPLDRIYPDLAWCYHQLGQREKAREIAKLAREQGSRDDRLSEILGE